MFEYVGGYNSTFKEYVKIAFSRSSGYRKGHFEEEKTISNSYYGHFLELEYVMML